MVAGCRFPRKQPLEHARGVPLAKEVVEPARNKYAVLVGINYLDDPASRLGGCINDANHQRQCLIANFGFDPRNIRLVTDAPENKGTPSYPTSKNIKAAISWLVTTCTRGDLIFFAYSGHGANLPDEDGTEADGKDEILCPVDLGKYLHEWQANAIRDDFLFRKFHDELPEGVKCICSYDCCHSGTISDLPSQRGMASAPSQRSARSEGITSRAMTQPEEVEAAIYRMRLMANQQGARSRGMPGMDIVKPGGRAPRSKDVWAFSGCRDDQTSADATLDGVRQGAMTWALLKGLREHGFREQYEPLLVQMRQLLSRGFSQVPQLATTRDELFDHVYMENRDGGSGGDVIVLDHSPPAMLAPGQTVMVADTTDREADVFRLGLSWDITAGKSIDLDAGVIMLDASMRPLDLVFFKQLESKAAGCVKHFGDNRSGAGSGDDETVQVDVNAIARRMPNCQYVGFVINSYSGDELNDVQSAHARLYDTDRPHIDIAKVDMSSDRRLDCTALLMCCLFRSGHRWYLRSIVEGAAGKTVHDNVDELQAYCQKHLRKMKQTAPSTAKLRVDVPSGVPPGGQLRVQVPSGYFVSLQVPRGARPGTTLEFTSPPGFVE